MAAGGFAQAKSIERGPGNYVQRCREGIWLWEGLFYSQTSLFIWELGYTEPRAAGLPGGRGDLNFGNEMGIPLPVRAGGEVQVPKLEMGKQGLPGPTVSEPVGQMARG